MAAQNLSKPEFRQWRKSFARLESRFETIFAEIRSTRTVFESRHTPTSPPSVTALVPPPVSAATPPASPPKTAQTPSLVPIPKSVHVAISTSARKSASSLPKPTLSFPPIYTTSTSVKPTLAALTCVLNHKATSAMEKKGSIVHLEGEDFDNRMLNHFVRKIKSWSPNVEATGETDLQPRAVAHL
ncbi:hypothetical protein HanIR_Chr02g0086341 [Helianthus annuus]|nr:hypothetical protein HanIR_Chr02g0086341 [Helianthus annuus]